MRLRRTATLSIRAGRECYPLGDAHSRSALENKGFGMSAPQCDPRSQLLTLLPEDELARLLPHLERVTLPLGESLCESGGVMQQAYLPLNSFIS